MVFKDFRRFTEEHHILSAIIQQFCLPRSKTILNLLLSCPNSDQHRLNKTERKINQSIFLRNPKTLNNYQHFCRSKKSDFFFTGAKKPLRFFFRWLIDQQVRLLQRDKCCLSSRSRSRSSEMGLERGNIKKFMPCRKIVDCSFILTNKLDT